MENLSIMFLFTGKIIFKINKNKKEQSKNKESYEKPKSYGM